MNNKQLDALKRLEDQLRERRDLASRLPNRGESKEQYLFTEVQGVTVIIGPRGGYQLPAVRRYPETSKPGEKALDAAVYADEFWKQQNDCLDCDTGHYGPIVDTEWQCGIRNCPCHQQSYGKRLGRSVKGK
jgi:hypothetical protein